MPYKRKGYRRKAVRKGKKWVRSRLNQGKIYSYKRVLDLSQVGPGLTTDNVNCDVSGTLLQLNNAVSGGNSYGALSYYASLDQLPDNSEFTSLYDQYKITGIKLEIIPFNNTSNAGTTIAGSNVAACLHSVVDFDDVSLPTASLSGVQKLMQYQNYKRTMIPGRKLVRFYRPHLAVGAYSGAFTSYLNKGPQWIDCGSPSVQHYGFKMVPEIFSSTASTLTCKMLVTMYVKFKNVR